MVATKRCPRGTSINDSSYPQRRIKNSNRDLVTFFHFQGPKKNAEKRMRWIVHVGAVIIFNITAQWSKDSLYICRFCLRESTIQATRSKELVSFYGSVAFIYELFRSHDCQPKRKEFLKNTSRKSQRLDHRTQVLTKNICQALLSF